MAAFLYYDDIHKYAKFYVNKYNSENEIKLSLKYLYSLDNIEEKLQIMMEDENKKRKESCTGFSFEQSSKGGKKGKELGIGIHAPITTEERSRRAKKAAKTLEERTGKKGGNLKTWEEANPKEAAKQRSLAGKKGIKSAWDYYRANPDKLEERSERIKLAAKERRIKKATKELKIIYKKIKTTDWFSLKDANILCSSLSRGRIGGLLRDYSSNGPILREDLGFFEKKFAGNRFIYKKIIFV